VNYIVKILIIIASFFVTQSVFSNESMSASKSGQYKHAKFTKSNLKQSLFSNLKFDFNYSGDVSGIPSQLYSYDSHLLILHALGTKKSLNISISLQSATIYDVIDAIATQTNEQVNLIFNNADNSVRLNYLGSIDVGRDAVSESLKWQQGGTPRPVLKQDGVVRFPYGEYQAIITCQPLNLCDIELQAGEDVQGIIIGDSQHWNEGDNGIPLVYSGSATNLTPHLVLKPSQGGLDTTLMITTSKRTYMLKIKSALNGYVARVGFYYPAEMIQKFNENKAKLKVQDHEQTQSTNPDLKMPIINLSKVSYAYNISGDNYVWKPTQVFDDGVSVYIQLPHSVSSRSLPGLCVAVDGDSSGKRCEMVNFRFNDNFYIVDKLFEQAKLINGDEEHMQTITIRHKSEQPGFWSRLFN
jgi:type IV secretion system protein VirB9